MKLSERFRRGRLITWLVVLTVALPLGVVFMRAMAEGQSATGAYALQIQQRFRCVAGENLARGDVVAIVALDEKCYKADRTVTTKRPGVGFVLAAVSSGGDAQVVTQGFLGGLTGLTSGITVYLNTAGGLTTVTQSYNNPLGQALDGTRLRINIGTP